MRGSGSRRVECNARCHTEVWPPVPPGFSFDSTVVINLTWCSVIYFTCQDLAILQRQELPDQEHRVVRIMVGSLKVKMKQKSEKDVLESIKRFKSYVQSNMSKGGVPAWVSQEVES